MTRSIFIAAALIALSGCLGTAEAVLQQDTNPTAEQIAQQAEALVWDGTAEVGRVYADIFQDSPFDTGAVTVLSEEHGELHSYTLTPCRSGTAVCGARSAALQRTPDYFVVQNAYAGRDFYLSPGGDGYMKRNGVFTAIAWN